MGKYIHRHHYRGLLHLVDLSQHLYTVDARYRRHIFPAAGTFMHLGNSLTCEQTQHIGNAEFGTTSSFCWSSGLYLMPRGFERYICWIVTLSGFDNRADNTYAIE